MTEELDRIPKPFYRPISVGFDMDFIIHNEKRDRYSDCQYFKGDWLFGFKIPPFQRGFVWTEEQSKAFIESAWLGFGLGTYLMNKIERWVRLKGDPSGKLYIHAYDGFLLDGLQRVKAIHRYVNNEFPVFDLYWKDLTEREKRRFYRIEFCQCRVSIEDYQMLVELYNRLNFGGTPHTEEQRAK